jgi:hypothetical protein
MGDAMTSSVEIIPGVIRVASADVVLDTERAVWVRVDCNTKYAEIGAYSRDSDGTWSVYLDEGLGTLRKDNERDEPTEIRLHLRPGDWTLVADLSRYTANIVAVREP